MRYIMGIVTNNKSHAQADNDFNTSFNDGHKIKVQFNCEVLSGCEFKCPGCFVNRKGSNVGNFEQLLNAMELFKDNDYHISTINIGPTDLFGNNNIREILEDDVFKECLTKVTTIQFVTTLKNFDDEVVEMLNAIPKREGFMYDCNIALDFPFDWDWLEERIQLLNKFTDDLNYYFVYNMGHNDAMNDTVLEMSKIADERFDTNLQLNPSFFRAKKTYIQENLIEKWKKYDISDDLYPKTIMDKAQGGSLELNYTYCNNRFFWTPFVYDIVLIGTEDFQVKDESDIHSWTNIKQDQFIKQLTYTTQTDQCMTCPKQMTCIDKGVLSYMEHHSLTQCVYPDQIRQSI